MKFEPLSVVDKSMPNFYSKTRSVLVRGQVKAIPIVDIIVVLKIVYIYENNAE